MEQGSETGEATSEAPMHDLAREEQHDEKGQKHHGSISPHPFQDFYLSASRRLPGADESLSSFQPLPHPTLHTPPPTTTHPLLHPSLPLPLPPPLPVSLPSSPRPLLPLALSPTFMRRLAWVSYIMFVYDV